MPNRNLRNVEHRRAKKALSIVEEISKKDKPTQKKFRSLARSAGSLILKSGLLPALAYYLNKKDTEEFAKYILTYGPIKVGSTADPKQILQHLLNLDNAAIMYKTQEALAFIKWLKRFADGMLKVDEGNEAEVKDAHNENSSSPMVKK